MSAYVIVDVEVKNLDKYEEYWKLAPAIVKAHGGKYLARGNKMEYRFDPSGRTTPTQR